MGRGRVTQPPVDPESIREAFAVIDGAIVRNSTSQPATFTGPKGRIMCRVLHRRANPPRAGEQDRLGAGDRLVASWSGAPP